MWLIARLVFAGWAFYLRLTSGRKNLEAAGTVDGLPYFVEVHRQKGRVIRVEGGMALESGITFEFTRESLLDRFFKATGLSRELQTQDHAFDEKVYVACDHEGFHQFLRASTPARQAIAACLAGSFSKIWSDGRTLRISSKSRDKFGPEQARLLADLRRAFTGANAGWAGQFADPFVRRAVLLEAAVWSICGYAVAACIEYVAVKEDVHVLPFKLIVPGVAVALALLACLAALLVAALGRSSRAHRVIVESVVLLAVSLPLAGIQLISDVNRHFDRNPSLLVERRISGCERKKHRGRRGRIYYSYHLSLDPGSEGVRFPPQLRVAQGLFEQSAVGRWLRFEIGPGALGFPWYRSQRVLL